MIEDVHSAQTSAKKANQHLSTSFYIFLDFWDEWSSKVVTALVFER